MMRGQKIVEEAGNEAPRQDLLFVCSSGGHLAQLMTLRLWWENYPRRWVTFDLPDSHTRLKGEETIWCYSPTTRNVKNLFRNFFVATRTLRDRRPDVIISTGAAVAVPFFLLGAALGIPRIYIEVIDRVETPTLTGRICGHLTRNSCVQLEEQLVMYPKARVIGTLL